jgi:hypothetical protein
MSLVQQPQSNANGAIETELAAGRVLVTRMRGFVTGPLCTATFEQFRARAATTSGGTWIIDTLEVTGFQPSAVQVGARWFEVFKAHHGAAIVMVSNMSAVRMAAATLAFAVHIKVTICKDLGEAYTSAGLGPTSALASDVR